MSTFKLCDLMLRPTRRRRYTGLCILVAWLLRYVKRSGLSSWGTTSSTPMRNVGWRYNAAFRTVRSARNVSEFWLLPGVLSFQIDEKMRAMYEQTLRDWRGCEAIVRQREREKHAEALARCSSGASVERGPVQRDSTISTDASWTLNHTQPLSQYSGIFKGSS